MVRGVSGGAVGFDTRLVPRHYAPTGYGPCPERRLTPPGDTVRSRAASWVVPPETVEAEWGA
ncbi:hypothetical protein GCM10009624_19730 [Gordonia sinesedis]